MTVAKDIFPASRNAARARLAQFIPGAGQNYAFGRNTDPGPEQPSAVSKLSPYLRYRMITEQEVVQAVLEQYSLAAAEKFIPDSTSTFRSDASARCQFSSEPTYLSLLGSRSDSWTR